MAFIITFEIDFPPQMRGNMYYKNTSMYVRDIAEAMEFETREDAIELCNWQGIILDTRVANEAATLGVVSIIEKK